MKERRYEHYARRCGIKTAIHKGTRSHCPKWQAVFRCLLPFSTYQSFLLWLLGHLHSLWVQLRSHMSKWSDPGGTEPLDATAVILSSTMHATSLSTSSRIHLHSSDLYLCHLSSSGETKLFTSCSYLPVSLHPSTYQPTAAVFPPLLTSPCPLRCVWQDPSVAESSNSREQTGGRTERGRNASGLSKSVSSSNSIPSNLHLFLTHAVVSSLKLYVPLFLSH